MTGRNSSLATREKGPTTNVVEESPGSEPSFVRPRPSLTVDTDNENYRRSSMMNKIDMTKFKRMSGVKPVPVTRGRQSTMSVSEVSFVRPRDTSLAYDTDTENERLKEKNAKRIKLLSQEKMKNNNPIAQPPPKKKKKIDEKTASSISSKKKNQGKDSSYDTEAEMIKTLKNFDPSNHGNKFAPPSPSKVLKLSEKTRKKKTKGQEVENMEASPPHVVSFPTTPPLITVSQPRRRNEKRASTMKAVAKNKNNSNSESDEEELEGMENRTPKRFWRRNSGTDDVDFDPNKKNVTSQSQAQRNISQNYTKIHKTVGNLRKHVDAMVSSPEIDEPVIRPQQKSIMRRSSMAARNRSSQISIMSSSRSIQLPGSQTNNVYAKVLSQNFSNPNQLSQEPGASVNPELPSLSENDQENNVETEITSLEKEDVGIQITKKRKQSTNGTVTSPTARKSKINVEELEKSKRIRSADLEVEQSSDSESEEDPLSPPPNLDLFEQNKEAQMKKNVQASPSPTNSKENEVQKNRNSASIIRATNNTGDENNHSLAQPPVNTNDSESENEPSSSDVFDDLIIQPQTRKIRPQQAKVKLPSKKKAPLNQQTKDSDEEERQPAATGSNDSNSKQKKRPSPSEDPTSLPLVDHEEESENMQILPPLISRPAVARASRTLKESESRKKAAKVALQKPRKSVKNASLPLENGDEVQAQNILPHPQKKAAKTSLKNESKQKSSKVPTLLGHPWGPNHPVMKNEGKVLYNSNLLTKEDVEKLINKYAKSAKLNPEQKKNFHQNINLYLKNTFDDLCDETQMYYGVWSLQQLTKRLKQDGVLDADAKDNDYVALFENTVGSKATKESTGFHIPKKETTKHKSKHI